MNPFRKSPTPLRLNDLSRWVCMESAWEKLNDRVEGNENTLILGVEGSGKTSLLNMLFTPEYCSLAASRGKLVFFADPSITKDGNDLCHHLIKQLQNSVGKHLPEVLIQGFEDTLKANKAESEKRQFILACEHLYDKGFMLLMVMDRFEQFVSASNITQDQHDMLRSLLDKDIMRCVVATNYDLEKSSLPEDIAGSLYLQKFQQKITLSGFSLEEAQKFIRKNIPEASRVQFSDKQVTYLYNLTGGIPLLFEQAACHMYDMLERGMRIVNSEFRAIMYNEAKPTIQRWFKIFPQVYADVVELATRGLKKQDALQVFRIRPSDSLYNAASRLHDRGFLVNKLQSQAGSFVLNSPLLQLFLINEYLPKVQHAPASVTPNQKQASGVFGEKQQKQYNVFISYKRTFEGNDTRDSAIAMAVYERLCKEEGLVPFLDKMEMPYGNGGSDAWDTIYDAISTAQSFVFVATQCDFLAAPCLKAEWKAYTEELIAGRKPEGSVYGILVGVEFLDMPLRLRRGIEMFKNTPDELERLVVYLRNRLVR